MFYSVIFGIWEFSNLFKNFRHYAETWSCIFQTILFQIIYSIRTISTLVIIYILSPAIASSLGQKSTKSNLLLGPYCDTLCLRRPEVLHLYTPKCFHQSNIFLSEKYDVSRIAYTYRVHVYFAGKIAQRSILGFFANGGKILREGVHRRLTQRQILPSWVQRWV